MPRLIGTKKVKPRAVVVDPKGGYSRRVVKEVRKRYRQKV
jgi:hypothetical protein